MKPTNLPTTIEGSFRGPSKPDRNPNAKPAVLIVEDEPSICRALAIALTRQGYAPVTTTNGEDALYYLRHNYFDAMLVDFRIPDIRGDVIFHLAISLQPHLRTQTLFTTGDVTEEAAELIEVCRCPVLMKPFDLRDLGAAVQALLPSTPAQKEIKVG